jgi:uncharacterized delta-60 repeat protein
MRNAPKTSAPIEIHALEPRQLLASGDLDTTFNGTGLANASWATQMHEAVVLSNGKILVAATVERPNEFGSPDHAPAIARYNPIGTLDTTFGVNGITSDSAMPYLEAEAFDLGVQSDGKIVVALGYSWDSGFLLRLNPDGTRDSSFTPVTGAVGSQSLVITPDNKIVFDGFRYNSNGSPDSTFHRQYFDFGSNARSFYQAGNAVQPDGKIVVGGVVELNNGNWAYAAYRLNTNGSLDTTFHGGHAYIEDPKLRPFFTVDPSYYRLGLGAAMALLPDGRVQIGVGSTKTLDSTGHATMELRGARFTNRGSADTTFGTSGIAGTGIAMAPFDAELQSDGKVLFSGMNAAPVDNNGEWQSLNVAVSRLNTNGFNDSTFRLDPKLDSQSGVAYGLALQPDNKIIPVGGTDFEESRFPEFSNSTGIVARLLNDGTVQPPPPPPPPPPSGTQKPLRWAFGEREIIQAEDYDIGGEGVAYHDSTPGNQSGTYRANEGVDVGDITGGRVVGRANQGEWLEYTIRSPFTTTRNFTMQASYVTPKSGVSLNYYIDGRRVGSVALAPTGSYGGTYQLAGTTIAIPAGTHVLRVEFATGANDVGNFNWFRFVTQA